MPPRNKLCIFLVGGRRSGKTTLALRLAYNYDLTIIGGANGADNVKNRGELYRAFQLNDNFILESHQVNNMPVIHNLLNLPSHVLLCFLDTPTATRITYQKTKTGKPDMTQTQLETQNAALRFYEKCLALRDPLITPLRVTPDEAYPAIEEFISVYL